MSEITKQETTMDSAKIAEVNTLPKSGFKVTTKVSKIPLLLSLLALAGVAFLGYQGVYGKFGVLNQAVVNQGLTDKIVRLTNQNQVLQTQLNKLASAQEAMKTAIRDNAPSQTNLVVFQLNALIGSANQSLLLYHDYAAAIKLLNYAKQMLMVNSDPVFTDLKISLAKDLDNLSAQNTFDNIMVASQIDNLYQQSSSLKVTAPVSAVVSATTNQSAWEKFVANLKQSLLSLVKVEKSNQTVAEAITPENESLILQHLQIDLLNARQALLTRNQGLWAGSLNDAVNLLRHYFINDQLVNGQLQVLGQLKSIRLDANQANLDATMQSLVKLEQQTTRN